MSRLQKFLDAVRVDLPPDVLDRVVNGLVLEVPVEPVVGGKGVGIDGGAGSHVGPDTGLQGGLAAVLDHGRPDFPVALAEPDHGRLVLAPGARDLAGPDFLVHVPGLATNEGFVHLNGAVELLKGARRHRQPDAVDHEPSRLLRDSEGPGHLVRRDAVLGVGDEPDGCHPLVEAERGILEDGPYLEGELLLAGLALPQSPRGQVGVLGALATGADRPVGPAQLGDEFGADIQIREVPDRLQEGGRKW